MKTRWKNSAAVKFFLSYLAIVVFLFVVFYFFAAASIKDFHTVSLSAKMQNEARLVSRLLPLGVSGPALDQICRDLEADLKVRITVIDLDGKVLGDSEETSLAMENHGGRPEILQALATGTGTSARYSTTVRHEMLYRAVLEPENRRIVRLSFPLGAVEEAERSIRQAILAGLLLFSGLGLVPILLFSRQLERRVDRMVDFSENVSRGSFPPPIDIAREDEFSVLERNLNAMSLAIQEKIRGIVGEKEKLDSILRCMNEGVLVLDSRGRLILSNQNAQKMFGLPYPAPAGASLMEVSRRPEMRKLVDEILACDLSAKHFVQELSFDGRWLGVTAAELRGADDKAAGYILVFHDVTELKRLETMRADLVANVSHELRTPLTAIRGYAETLLQSPPADPKEAERFLDIIQRHSERLGRLIDDLLTLSDLESGKIQLNQEKIRPAQMIHRILEVFHERAAKKNVALSESAAADLPDIIGDSDRLQQLFINLIDNALKYTPEGGKIEVRALPAPAHDERHMVEIAVADTGCGIPEKDLPRLTERFYRVDKARSREMGGTGLGLAIVKHIVQAHRGRLQIESRIQKGTTVRVFLPAEDASVTALRGGGNGKTLRSEF